MIEKPSSTFPNAQDVISTLLPRNYFHPATIQDFHPATIPPCSKPNVFLAHHSTLHSLYDQVHLYKAAVPTFTWTLKDIALKRSPQTSHRSNRSIDTPTQTSETLSQTCGTPGPTHRGPTPRGPASRPQHHQPHTPPLLNQSTQSQVNHATPHLGPLRSDLAQANGTYQMLNRCCSHLLALGQTTRPTTLDTLWNTKPSLSHPGISKA
jgi:hypothetical protein